MCIRDRVYSIGNFPTLRCLEQIRNCCAYHEVNVKIVCVGAGFVYGTLGMTCLLYTSRCV